MAEIRIERMVAVSRLTARPHPSHTTSRGTRAGTGYGVRAAGTFTAAPRPPVARHPGVRA
jgi:hypothetical protein